MNTEIATQTDEQLLAEALADFGLTRADLRRFEPEPWQVVGDVVEIDTAAGVLRRRHGDGDRLTCPEGHFYFRWHLGCKQCHEKSKHSFDPATAEAARDFLGRLEKVKTHRARQIEAARSGGVPAPRKMQWGTASKYRRVDQ